MDIILVWSGIGGQLWTSSWCCQGLVISYGHHLAVVRGWRSAMDIILLLSGVGVSYGHHLAVVRGWWSAIDIILLWSGVGGQFFVNYTSCGHL